MFLEIILVARKKKNSADSRSRRTGANFVRQARYQVAVTLNYICSSTPSAVPCETPNLRLLATLAADSPRSIKQTISLIRPRICRARSHNIGSFVEKHSTKQKHGLRKNKARRMLLQAWFCNKLTMATNTTDSNNEPATGASGASPAPGT